MHKWIYHFGDNKAEGNSTMSDILGGKGANLAEMSNLGLNIPPGFTISSELCEYYYQNAKTLPKEFTDQFRKSITELQKVSDAPLLLAVRSGAAVSMPGMMDTILNLGMNDEEVEKLAAKSRNRKFAFDCYRRFLEMYGDVVLGVPRYLFEEEFESNKNAANIYKDIDVTAQILEKIVGAYKNIILKHSSQQVPDDLTLQLEAATQAVLESWQSKRAVTYRKLNDISDLGGTAVNIQTMVFGNRGENSATGVVFTRCPASGDKQLFGEFLINAQGEDIVAGIRTPMPIIAKDQNNNNSMQIIMPKIFAQLSDVCTKLEIHYRDVQDIEFTVEENRLFILQTRSAKRTAIAAIKTSVDMVLEELISKEEALLRVEPETLGGLLHSNIDYAAVNIPKAIAQGMPASPGAVSGIAVFSTGDAEELSHHHKVILVRNDTSPEDISGMHAAKGILTARGGMTSHAAVVARGMGKPCVCGVNNLIVSELEQNFRIGDLTVKHGQEITIDGATGKVFLGKVPLLQPSFNNEFETLLLWADKERQMEVRANAETITDVETALKFGASGVGLCRTEHMFFDKDKLPLVREMIVAPDKENRVKAIDKLLPLQIQDFKNLFRILKGKPINIRLLDPPLHEFLPIQEEDKKSLADSLNISASAMQIRLSALDEVNPMLGHRGCRLAISFPEIYQMQVKAIFTAIVEIYEQENIKSNLELMIPLISEANELRKIKQYIGEAISSTKDAEKIEFKLGTMIELPRAALMAGEMAHEVDYFSFGTNDLTQTTYGISRDDTASFLPDYLEQKIFAADPFIKIDVKGVGELIKIACQRAREKKPELKIGVCGEHAGNPYSIDFFAQLDMDYVSCSPYRIPIARLSAARAQIKIAQIKTAEAKSKKLTI